MRFLLNIISLVLSLLVYSVAYCQVTKEDIRQWLLVEGILSDTHYLKIEIEKFLTTKEFLVPEKIVELEKKLTEASISDKQQIAKELIPLQFAYCQHLMRNDSNKQELLVNLIEWCYYLYLADDPSYLGSYARVCQMVIEYNYTDYISAYYALHADRFVRSPFVVLGDHFLEKNQIEEAIAFYRYSFPINPTKDGKYWDLFPGNIYDMYDAAKILPFRYIYKTLLSYPLYMERMARIAKYKNLHDSQKIMNEAFLSAADLIQWSFLQDELWEQERLLELLGPGIKQQYSHHDTRWAYDAALFMKDAATYSSLDFMKIVMESGSPNRMQKYHEYLEARKNTLKDNTLENIEKQKEIFKSFEFERILNNQYLSSIRCEYDDVFNKLPESSCAIEFICVENRVSGQIEYDALILRYDNALPYRVHLCDGDTIERLYTNGADIYRPDKKVSADMFDIVWGRLEAFISDLNIIYFSPDGLFHTINIESLFNPKTNTRIYNEKEIHRLISTKQLCFPEHKSFDKTALLLGGLDYDMTIEDMQKGNLEYEGYLNAYRGFAAVKDARPWPMLNGAHDEVQEIRDILYSQAFDVKIRTRQSGTEEFFKSLSSQKLSILHIATHGFYFDNLNAKNTKFYRDVIASDRGYEFSPMRRSGLILSGGNNAWLGKSVPSNVEDGILLSEEIAIMDLSGTELLVLSACDTGLGELSADGLSGLQRAFKRAGVGDMVVTNAKVHDRAAQMFMNIFYKKLTEINSVHKAFRIAQNSMEESDIYGDPYYWAAFMLIE